MRCGSVTRGVTLIEMLIVMAIVSIVISISFPAVSAGLETIQLRSAADSVVALLNGALNRADRHEEPVEVIISPKENAISLYSTDPAFTKRLEMPHGIKIAGEEAREFLLMPGGAPPRADIDLVNARGVHRMIRIDPITGVPQT